MCVYANRNMQKLTIFGKSREIDDEHSYHDAELFKENKSDIEISNGHEKIQEFFHI